MVGLFYSEVSMLLSIEGNDVKVMDERDFHKTPKICKTLARVKDELEGYLEYKDLEKESAKYGVPRLQECMHLFLALDDFITELHGMLNDEEKAEYKKWKAGLES